MCLSLLFPGMFCFLLCCLPNSYMSLEGHPSRNLSYKHFHLPPPPYRILPAFPSRLDDHSLQNWNFPQAPEKFTYNTLMKLWPSTLWYSYMWMYLISSIRLWTPVGKKLFLAYNRCSADNKWILLIFTNSRLKNGGRYNFKRYKTKSLDWIFWFDQYICVVLHNWGIYFLILSSKYVNALHSFTLNGINVPSKENCNLSIVRLIKWLPEFCPK